MSGTDKFQKERSIGLISLSILFHAGVVFALISYPRNETPEEKKLEQIEVVTAAPKETPAPVEAKTAEPKIEKVAAVKLVAKAKPIGKKPAAKRAAPNHINFTIKIEHSLHILNGTVIIFYNTSNIKPQSKTI